MSLDLDLSGAESMLQVLADVFQPPGSRSAATPAPPLSGEARYRALVDQLPAVVFMASLDGGIGDAYVSPQIEAALGFSQGEWLEDPLRWYEHIHPDDKARWSVEAAQMFLSGSILKSVYRVIARDGKVVWFQCEAKMMRGEDGRPYAIHGVGFDITRLKESERALSDQNIQLELLKDIATTTNQARTIAEVLHYAIERICSFTGWPLGRAFLVSADRRHAAASSIWNQRQNSAYQGFRAACGEMGFAVEGRLLEEFLAQPRPIWVKDAIHDSRFGRPAAQQAGIRSSLAFPVVNGGDVVVIFEFFAPDRLDPNNAILSIMAMVASQLGQFVERTRRLATETKFRKLLEAAPDAMVVANDQGIMVLVNAQMMHLFGYAREELLGQTTEMLLPERFRTSQPGRQNGFFADRGQGAGLCGLRKDGTEFPMALSLSPLETEEGTVGVAAVRDVTAQKEYDRRLEVAAEEAHEANRAKSAFLSTVSHEIRTPMNAILGYAQLMARDPDLNPAARANLKIICQSGEHLVSLITDILDMSKIEAGRIELNANCFHFLPLVDSLAAMFRLGAQARSLHFEVTVDGEPADCLIGDEGKIRQVLINLLGNAIKFTAQGHVKLRVTLERREEQRLWLSALVEDTGPGLTLEEQARLFKPFNQFKRGLKPLEGTGLGLSIGRNYARLMGGDITLESKPGEGARFRFEIPIESAPGGIPLPGPAIVLDHGLECAWPAVRPEQLANLPPALLSQLQAAVQDGEKDRLDQLIAQADAIDLSAAETLRHYADNYDYDSLTPLLQQAQTGNGKKDQ